MVEELQEENEKLKKELDVLRNALRYSEDCFTRIPLPFSFPSPSFRSPSLSLAFFDYNKK